MTRPVLTLVAALATALVGACARQGTPPGGPEDRRPPVVVSTEPDTFAMVEEFDGPVRFHFDERVSERVGSGTMDDAVLVSPRTGDVRVGHGRSSLSVEIEGGFRPGLVYRVTLLPVVRDLFSNQMGDPFELVFTTGGTLTESAVVGLAWDRITGQGMDALDVYAIAAQDSTLHVARTDTGGIYAFRYLDPGRYRIVAFMDQNRNREVDAMEVQGQRTVLLSGADTLFLDVSVLQPDTTPARLVQAEALDSVTVVLEFDDYLDPTEPVRMSVGLSREEGEAPVIAQLFHEHEYVEWLRAVQDSFVRLDSIDAAEAVRAAEALVAAEVAAAAADTAGAAADTLAAVPDTAAPVVAEPPPPPDESARRLPPPLPAAPGARPTPPGEEPATPDGNPLPSRRAVARLRTPLAANVEYQLIVRAVVNLHGIPLGTGELALMHEPPVDSTALDTLALDTLSPDTARVPPDTGRFVLPRLRGRGGAGR